MKSLRTEGCHVGLSREFVGTACCTYGQSNTTNGFIPTRWQVVAWVNKGPIHWRTCMRALLGLIHLQAFAHNTCESTPLVWFFTSRLLRVLGLVYKANYPVPLISDFFRHWQNIRYILNITYIFDSCHRSWAAVTSIKNVCDSNNLRGTFARFEKFACGDINEWSFSNPHPRWSRGYICNSS